MEWIYLSTGAAALLLGGFTTWLLRRKRKPTAAKPLTLGLEKSRQNFLGKIQKVFLQPNQGKEEVLAQLEEILISADLGVKTTQSLMVHIENELKNAASMELAWLQEKLGEEICRILRSPIEDLDAPQTPHVMMIVGVNGVGKTTTIGKLAHHYKEEGNKTILAAADTFRAGAGSQLKVWGERVGAKTLVQKEGSDPAALAFDAVQAGVARGLDRVLIDTAGRLHTKINLMEELKKVKRVITKAMPSAPHEVWLVLDATQGQNALQQAKQFHEALQLTGVVLTKLDSTAKGGMAVAVTHELKVPIVYVGVGEQLNDLRPFDAREFVDGLLG